MAKAYSNVENKADLEKEAKTKMINSDLYSTYEDFLIKW